MTEAKVFPRAKHQNHAPKPRQASADGSFVDRCRAVITFLEVLAISLVATRWEENQRFC